MAKRSRRRKGAARRKSRRRSAGVALMNSPRKRRRHHARRSARRNPFRAARRRHFRRNPPGLVGVLTGALVDGSLVAAGDVGQNLLVRNIPDLVPATMANAPMLNGLIKDVGGIVLGAYGVHKVLPADHARMVVAGQTFAAISRLLRAWNIPVVSTALGEYDPMRLSGYVPGTSRVPGTTVVRALPAPKPNNVSTLARIGIYSDGMSNTPSLY